MAQLITREELAHVIDESISEERFNGLYDAAIRVVRTGYRGDPEQATGYAADVITGVLQGVMMRIMANPKGARTVGLGSANVTFGGKDSEVANVFALNEYERADLARVSPRRSTGVFTISPRRT